MERKHLIKELSNKIKKKNINTLPIYFDPLILNKVLKNLLKTLIGLF